MPHPGYFEGIFSLAMQALDQDVGVWKNTLIHIQLDPTHHACHCIIYQGYNQPGQGAARGVDKTSPGIV